jgi:putative peptidoglycan lipid II flippase
MSLLKSGLAVASGTAMSRITGFMRDILVAKFLGASDMADIWVAAFRFPNMFRRIIGEGAFNAAFLPVYSEIHNTQGSTVADLFAGRVLSRMTLVIGLGILLCQICMPYLVYIIAPGYSAPLTQWFADLFYAFVHHNPLPALPILGQTEKISLTITMTIICLPYAGFMFLSAIQSAILNYHNKFMYPALVAALLNITLIAGLIGSHIFNYSPLLGLGWASFIAGFLQSFMLYIVLKKAGLTLKFHKPTSDIFSQKFFKLFVPGMISGGVTQINLLIGSIIASFTSGAMAYLYYADRIYQLPLSLIGVSLGIVLLPNLTKAFQNDNHSQITDLLSRAIEFATFSTLPAVFALVIIPHDIVAVLFETGKFTTNDTHFTAIILMIYGFGLPAFIGIKLFSSAYYARHDTKTPMIYATWSIGIDIFVALSLLPFFKFYAIPIAGITAGWFNVIMLITGLKQKQAISFDNTLLYVIGKIMICCFIMGLFLVFFKYYLIGTILSDNRLNKIILIFLGMLVYFMACYSFKIFPRSMFKKFLKR